MPDAITVMGGLTAIKTALDITKTLSDARDSTKLLAVKLELQGLLLEAQEAQFALASQKRELEERVRQFEKWDSEKERYELKRTRNGSLVYVLKPECEGTEPAHMACANCYEHARRSILQPTGHQTLRHWVHRCPLCASEVIGEPAPPEPPLRRAIPGVE